jgi:FkbM family methyltransferase
MLRLRNGKMPQFDPELLDRRLFELLRPYGDLPWWEGANLWEPSVQLALSDLCVPGAVAFDVGANLGGLTAIMSRLVGPKGTVCSFEASPRIFAHLQGNVVKQGFHNVFTIPRAVFSRSHDLVQIFHGDHLNDSIYGNAGSASRAFSMVETVALDDFVEAVDLVPHIVKMDIEGAEYDALLGCGRLLEERRPHLILEQQTDDSRCLSFLIDRGYRAVDLNTLREIATTADYPVGVGLRNVLFVHQARIGELPYEIPVDCDEVMDIAAADIRTEVDGFSIVPLRLPPGRYLADMRFSAQGTDNEMICGARIDGRIIFQYHAYTRLLSDSYRDWIFDVHRESTVELFFAFHGHSRDTTFAIQGGRVSRLRCFRQRNNARLLLT